MAFDEDKYLDYGPTKREQWAEDHGYMHYTCPQHGGFYSDTGEGCPSCPEEPKEDPDEYDDEDPDDFFEDLYDDDISEPLGDAIDAAEPDPFEKELREEYGSQRLEERYGNQS